MRRILITLTILLSFHIFSNAQQLPLYSQYIENGFMLNPAMAGSRIFSPVRISMRQQWTGVKGAPETQAVSYNKNFGPKNRECNIMGSPMSGRNNQLGVGLGGYFFNDKQHSITRTGLEISYAYHMQISGGRLSNNGTKLSLGFGGVFYQFKFDSSELPMSDPLYTGANEVSFVPDFNLGVYLYNDNYFVGLSASHVMESTFKIGDNHITDNVMERHMYALAGYTFHFPKFVDLEPSVMVMKTNTSDLYYDATLKLYINHLWLAASYRTNEQFVGMIGVSYSHYYLGYAYDYYSNNVLASTSNGTHEITVGVNLDIPPKMLRQERLRKRRAADRNYSRTKTSRFKRESKGFLFF
ncbi:MAG: PorP/SprF family type IX secretion system membrane protein [Marinifilaceae bacterium]|jgi:type IX secretion system PorP/SprF family membrane protein|nr:PorP/SprF family type IX secretion system membrane protein [Marinifilaceae bacterium]